MSIISRTTSRLGVRRREYARKWRTRHGMYSGRLAGPGLGQRPVSHDHPPPPPLLSPPQFLPWSAAVGDEAASDHSRRTRSLNTARAIRTTSSPAPRKSTGTCRHHATCFLNIQVYILCFPISNNTLMSEEVA